MKEYTIAFVGNPNVGKSAWINAVSDAGFQVGNWPGVTVERKQADVIWNHMLFHLIDLPGCYSLETTANEERITSTFLKEERVDLIVNVVDASNLSRNLYLTLLLRELQIPMLLIFNFMDVVENCHIQIDFIKMSRRLQIPILPVSAFRSSDAQIVKKEIIRLLNADGFYYPLLSNQDVACYVDLINYLQSHLPTHVNMSEQQLHCFAFSLLKEDVVAWKQIESWYLDRQAIKDLIQGIDALHIQNSRYDVIHNLMSYVVQQDASHLQTTKKLDAIFLHRYFGLPIFFLLFSMMLLIVFQASAPFNAFIQFLINDVIRSYLAILVSFLPSAVQACLLDGILAGVGGVLTFIPLMAILYFMMALLEESGYMSRIACLLDRMMRVFHLSGKSFVALLLGFGCNVPAIYAVRTLDNEQQKRLTACLIPFMSCGARLPVYVLFASAFFQQKAAVMILSVYGIGILIALLLALILSRRDAFRDDGLFVIELPSYHIPNRKVVFHKVKQEVISYVRKATGIVLWAMVLLWGISYFPNGTLESSYMATVAKQVAPLYEPAGFGDRWECVAALPGSIVAKETIVGYFTSILQVEQDPVLTQPNIMEDLQRIKTAFVSACKQSVHETLFPSVRLQSQQDQQVSAIRNLWHDKLAELRAFCFMVYVLLSIPCIMSLQALYHEYGWKLMTLSILTMIIVPYVTSVVLFQFFSFLL